MFLLNKKVCLGSLCPVLRERTGLVKPCLGIASKNKGWFLLHARRSGVRSQPLGMTDTCLAAMYWCVLISGDWWGTQTWAVHVHGSSCTLISQFNWLLKAFLARNPEWVLIRFGLSWQQGYLRAELQCYGSWMFTASSLPALTLLKVAVKPTEGFPKEM